ncbi:hypothetical protein H9655_08975 [Cytobacillus sp. Sa5YUA1]|uniref:Transposase n=1 Tax=Cytobacillus stercorigallinarum TaxID=2762240 RepID=A0ABR8QNU2_9BACI|nr:hypothetical protein [Cytobacillus stercorigallinarum]MBD7937163.1 hypothetical protein [Cytobacillus stercorigallinarum]
MSAIDELKEIIQNQKSISTKKLESIITEFERMYIAQGKKIRSQKNNLSVMNTKYQRERDKAKKREEMAKQLEALKLHHHNLTREFNYLLEKYKRMAKK